jgi:hypothetical protein
MEEQNCHFDCRRSSHRGLGRGREAVGFPNMLHIAIDDGISYVVDINSRKSPRFVPGAGQEIVPTTICVTTT